MSADLTTVKKLYGFSYNECAHPDCDQVLVEIDQETGKAVNYGELAHIHGQQRGAERFDQKVYDDKDKLHGFDNILILCAKHHHQVDQSGAGEHYTADMLREWKMQHIQRKSATELDREWVYGGQTIVFWHGDAQVNLSYWLTKQGALRFHTPEQLRQCDAARDISLALGQISSLLNMLDQASGEPASPSHISQNDSFMRMLKKSAEDLKTSWLKKPPDNGYESALHRIYQNLMASPDITLSELAEVGTEKRAMKTTLLVGEATTERIGAALENAREDAKKAKD